MKKVRPHCKKCYEDKDETSQVQAERIRHQLGRVDSLVAWKGRKVEITVDGVLRARERMMKNNARGPSDCLATEMLQQLSMGQCTRSPSSLRNDSEDSGRLPAA